MDDALASQLLPALTGRSTFSTEELELLRLPARLGGMGIPHLAAMAAEELAASRAMTEGQVREILLQTTEHETSQVNSIHGDAVSARNRPYA